jgi:nitrate/nitrite-specific signal transduction histidine kinase
VRKLTSSLAYRLTVWFLLLCFLPIAVIAIFVRRSVTEAMVELGLEESGRQARILAEAVAAIGDEPTIARALREINDDRHSAFLLGADGTSKVTAGPAAARAGPSNLPAEIRQAVLSGGVGALVDSESGRLIGFAEVPSTEWLAVVVTEPSLVTNLVYRIERRGLAQLGASLAIVSVVGGLAIEIVIGPVRKLTAAAEAVGAGDLSQHLDEEGMEGELLVLTGAFNQMVSQLRTSHEALEQRVADRTKELSALNSIATVMSQSLVLDEIIEDALEKVLERTGFESGAVFVREGGNGQLRMAVHRGLSEQFREEVSRGILSVRVAETGESLILEDLSLLPDTPGPIRAQGYKAFASLPLLSKGQVEGVLTIASRRAHRFDEPNVELLRSIANQMGVAIENARLYEQERWRADRFRVINDVGRQITSILDVDTLLREITRLVSEGFGYYIVLIGLVEGEELVLRGTAGPTRPTPFHFDPPLRLPLTSQGLTVWVANHGQPLLVPDVSQEPRFLAVAEIAEIRSECTIPIKIRGSVIGVLDAQSDRLNAFDQRDILILESLANQAGVAIENARLYQQARRMAALEERQRLARDLHDSVTQEIYGVTMFAEAAGRMLAHGQSAQAAEHLRDLRASAWEALAEMRLLIHELRPLVLEQVGLEGALRARLESVEGRSGVRAELEATGEGELPAEVQEELYSIAREALNNALKHAKPRSIRVRLDRGQSSARLSIADDGLGFSPAEDHGGIGIKSMQERAQSLGGSLTIESEPGQGTTVTAEVSW